MKARIAATFPALVELKQKLQVSGKAKIFCIGKNKTGTTSLAQAFRDLGYRVGSEREAARLIRAYAMREFEPIIRFCGRAQVFEDIPFSLPYTFQILDHAFSESKFILTVRDSADQWYDSLVRHCKRKYGRDGNLPSKEDLSRLYKTPGINRWEFNRLVSDTPEDDLYNKAILEAVYDEHNRTVLDYFRHRKQDLLVINLSEPGSYQRFCAFLKVRPLYERFPHRNRSAP